MGSHVHDSLIHCLRAAGLRTHMDVLGEGFTGFSVPLVAGEERIIIDQPEPTLLLGMDPTLVGVAILDPLYRCRVAWGAAERVLDFRGGYETQSEALREMVRKALHGHSGSVYVEGYRYHYMPIEHGGEPEVFVLVTDASEEQTLRGKERLAERTSRVLGRVGQTLSMYREVAGLANAAVHEVASAAELAAAMLWVHDEESGFLELKGAIGLNPAGLEQMRRLRAGGGDACLAEIVAETREPFTTRHLAAETLGARNEIKFCYLRTGGAAVLPLTSGDQLLGVLELVGHATDSLFADSLPLYSTIAEHLALALSAAKLYEQAQRLATHDPLTGIANHRSMQDFLHRRLAEAGRKNEPVGVIMLDVDDFRLFNEEFGHAVGDRVLVRVAQTLRQTVRLSDMAARYGGEEFTVILPGQRMERVVQAAERIRKRIERMDLADQGVDRPVTVSLGCASCPETTDDAASLLRAADTALYEAKRAGRNCTRFFEGKFVVRADDRSVTDERYERRIA